MGFLTPQQLQSFNDNGFLVLPSFFDPLAATLLMKETNHLLDVMTPDRHNRVRFTTGGDRNSYAPPVGDDYFLASNDKIRYFFEPSAFNAHNKLDRAPHLAVNKIGHAVHAHSTRFLAATLFHQNIEIAHDLGFRDPRVLQSMIICKQPGIGGAVPPHKDSEFLYTDPPSAVGFWIAMENATQQNGGLGFWKGSHKRSPVTRRFVRKQDGSGTEFIPWQGTGMPRGMEMQPGVEEYQTCDDDFELVNANAGDLVLIHGNVLHASQQNLSDRSRFAYTFHVIEGEEEYDARNWLQPPDGGFTRLAYDGP